MCVCVCVCVCVVFFFPLGPFFIHKWICPLYGGLVGGDVFHLMHTSLSPSHTHTHTHTYNRCPSNVQTGCHGQQAPGNSHRLRLLPVQGGGHEHLSHARRCLHGHLGEPSERDAHGLLHVQLPPRDRATHPASLPTDVRQGVGGGVSPSHHRERTERCGQCHLMF